MSLHTDILFSRFTPAYCCQPVRIHLNISKMPSDRPQQSAYICDIFCFKLHNIFLKDSYQTTSNTSILEAALIFFSHKNISCHNTLPLRIMNIYKLFYTISSTCTLSLNYHGKVLSHTFNHFNQIPCLIFCASHNNILNYHYTFFLRCCTHTM